MFKYGFLKIVPQTNNTQKIFSCVYHASCPSDYAKMLMIA